MIGFMMMAVLGQCKFSWYHALKDVISNDNGGVINIFQAIKQFNVAVSNDVSISRRLMHLYSGPSHPIDSFDFFFVIKALIRLSSSYGRTKYPCRLFLEIVDVDVGEKILPEHFVSIPRLLLVSISLHFLE
jgi:hypothetical protein